MTDADTRFQDERFTDEALAADAAAHTVTADEVTEATISADHVVTGTGTMATHEPPVFDTSTRNGALADALAREFNFFGAKPESWLKCAAGVIAKMEEHDYIVVERTCLS